MNAKVTTYWMFGKNPVTQVMPEERVEAYLANCRSSGTMKGYIVDAVPLDEIQPRAPIAADAVTTIFPAPINGKVHAAFVMDYRTDEWATRCGKAVKDPSTVEHRVAAVECAACIRRMR